MKLTVRLLSLLLILCMTVAIFAACGAKTTEPQQGGDDDTDTDDDDDFPEHLKGVSFADDNRTIRFLVGGDTESGGYWERSIRISEDDDPDYNVNAAVIERNTNVEGTLKTKIEVTNKCGMQEMADVLQPILAGSLDTYDVVSGYQYFDIGLAFGDNSGSFINLKHTDSYIRYDQTYWDTNTFNTLAYKDAAYWITGDLSLTWTGTLLVTFVNKRLWSQFSTIIKEETGYTDIYDVVNNNKWTMTTLLNLTNRCFEDKDGDEKPSEGDIVGFCCADQDINCAEIDSLVAGCHINYSKYVDGVPKVDFYTERNQKFADLLYKLMNQSNAYTPKFDGEHAPKHIFAEGNVLFLTHQLHDVEEEAFTNMTDDYYIIPCPMLDEAQVKEYGGYASSIFDSVSQYGIPSTCQYIDATSATLELMAYWSYKLVTPAYFDIALKNRYTRDTASADVIDKIRASVYTDFATLWSEQLGNITWFFRSNCQSRGMASALKAKQKSWSTNMENLLLELESSTAIEK